jgi:hypothetical protein
MRFHVFLGAGSCAFAVKLQLAQHDTSKVPPQASTGFWMCPESGGSWPSCYGSRFFTLEMTNLHKRGGNEAASGFVAQRHKARKEGTDGHAKYGVPTNW